MGLLSAAGHAIGGVLSDQWQDFYGVPTTIAPTALFFGAERANQPGRSANVKGNNNVITNGSRIVVPDGYGLILMENGAITALAVEPGAYVWDSRNLASQSIFAGDGIISPLIKSSWDRFKFGGQAGAHQKAYYVSLKEIPNNRFGTQSTIYWMDKYLNAQVGATTRGSYTLKIIDPILFVKSFLPASYLNDGQVFDLTDLDCPVSSQLFNEVVGSLAPAFSNYVNDQDKGNSIIRIQQDSIGFAKSLAKAVEENFQWKSERGLEIIKSTIVAIEYDIATKALLEKVQRADALSGARGNSNLQASLAAGLESAGEHSGPSGVMGMGFAAGMGGNMFGGMQQPVQPSTPAPTSAEDPVAQLTKAKGMLDAGLITQEDYDKLKSKILGI